MGQRLWEQANLDIQVANRLLSPDSYYAAANYAHQAAEKALKAACWHLRGEEPPWTHDLADLAESVVPAPDDLPATVDLALDQLMPIIERTRYPSGRLDVPIPGKLVGEREAREALASAGAVMSWVQTLLLRPPGKTRPKKS